MISGLFSLPLTRHSEVEGDPSRAGNGSQSVDHGEPFLAGPENLLVRSLAAAVAESLPYNPIVLTGPSGVGKSAVAQALAAQRIERMALKNIIATTGSDFARSFASAIDNDSVADLRSRHQRCDLLLIDDLHRLATKPAAQQFLLSIIDALIRRGSLVLGTLRQSPQATRGLLPGLASRLTSGLVAPLAPPGPLARRELVQRFSEQLDLPLADEILAQVSGNGSPTPLTAPRLRHAVLQLAAASRTNQRPVRAAHVTQLLAAETPEVKVVIKQTALAVSKQTQIPLAELKGKCRQQTIADARGLAMFIARRLTHASYAEIGRHFGNRDHSTVLHACRKFDQKIKHDNQCRRLCEELSAQIAAGDGC